MTTGRHRTLPPRLLRYDLEVSDQLPGIAKIVIVAEDGRHAFLVNIRGLNNIATASLETAKTLSMAFAKPPGAKH
jgi:hypothetical protein